MRVGRTPLLWALLALTAWACGDGSGPAGRPAAQVDVPERAVERARAAADALGDELMQRLLAELEEGGPTRGLRVCSEVAQEIAERHSRDGLTVRRVSLRVRNPADEPDPWERAKLEELAALRGDGRMPEELYEIAGKGEEQALRYLRPIVIFQPCLDCHGDPDGMDPAVVELIRERYPDDRATGYSDGDLRGAISATVRLD